MVTAYTSECPLAGGEEGEDVGAGDVVVCMVTNKISSLIKDENREHSYSWDIQRCRGCVCVCVCERLHSCDVFKCVSGVYTISRHITRQQKQKGGYAFTEISSSLSKSKYVNIANSSEQQN